jgi:MFS superfamily sulfate permease-like transporter
MDNNPTPLFAKASPGRSSSLSTLKFYCYSLDARFEDLGDVATPRFYRAILRDVHAGFIGAMVAIPLAISYSMAAGLKPSQGIVGGALAVLLGAIFGGSKYQVCGPSAAFIPLLSGIMALHTKGGVFYVDGLNEQEAFRRGHGFLVLVSLLAAIMLSVSSFVRACNWAAKIPRCIVVGFTIGIAVTIGFAFAEEALGIENSGAYSSVWLKSRHIYEHIGKVNPYALMMAAGTLICMQSLLYVSLLIPAPLLALICSTILAQTVWSEKHLHNIADVYGHIPQIVAFTPPVLFTGHASSIYIVWEIAHYSLLIAFIGTVESLLCARMADNLAGNRGVPFHPNKELWGQSWVGAVVPLFNSFPHTGALVRTALNAKLGAKTPLAGIVHSSTMIATAFAFARWLEILPLASIAGILLYVAINMVSTSDIAAVQKDGGWAHLLLMSVTAIFVIAVDFLVGFASGMIVYAIGFWAKPYLPTWLRGVDSQWPYAARYDEEIGFGSEDEKSPMLKDRST